MEKRIAMWAGGGFLVAVCWVLCSFFSDANQWPGVVWVFVAGTCPVALARYLPHPFSWEFVLLTNALTYIVAGLIVETLRRRPHHA